ncbi:outer membrane receptor for ferrienterochelin and colicin [Luteibacter jiangsuensis]|uniref:Outer membrane receptor for ferrienterochelin and colicin n=1 Tax=Luteibacter jiangsuensis TaxID=637577 RepID=A0ABT9SWQ5_9GAMM|nr:TonB-dependent receptor [Luteibacter jiangsuensis]MDQ0009421.1 outer membrane receptor for ferrienterochelin and colicin [Luteibacter jiangsuensis]
MHSRLPIRRQLLAATLLSVLGTQAAFAQSTTGAISGQVGDAQGATVVVQGGNGLTREVTVDAKGRYSASQLPLGTYTVTLRRNGVDVDSRKDVGLRVGASTDVSFVASAANLEGVSVSASRLPDIDVTSVDSRSVITADQLAKLPLTRNADEIARLAPGVVSNSGGFKGPTGSSLNSFGGSAASENAYYINGYNVTDPQRGMGGISLPYGAVDQQEVYTGGYSAQYGRSDGGVINQVGKRGSNEWHFGGQVLWEPAFARAGSANTYYTNGLPASPVAGDLYQPNREDRSWVTTVSSYVGGPLIKDKLFFFLAGEFERQEGSTHNNVDDTSPDVQYRYGSPRWYGKLDWNITDSHILEVTSASSKRETQGTIYDYDYSALRRGGRIGSDDDTKTGGDVWSAKYTGYITDDLTVSALYGKMKLDQYDQPGSYNGDLTYVNGLTNQNPALNGGSPFGNNQTVQTLTDSGRGTRSTNTRFDVTYVLGDHTISAGIDNQVTRALDQGSQASGDGYYWTYGKADPNTPISTGLGVPATGGIVNGEQGYYVVRHVVSSLASVRASQKAQYIEDKWQVDDRWLLSLGLRNDQFENYNRDGDAYVTQHRPQWAPRLGFSWDVNGDASFKVYGNAGRYYLGLPLNPGLNAAGASLSTSQYFTYGGIDAQGLPTGLTAFSQPVSSNNYYGVLPDPRTVTASNLKSEYQDEFILGFTKTLGHDWVYGAKATQRILRSAIDDYCDTDRIVAKAAALGYDVTTTNSCYLFNPGRANTFNVIDTSGNLVAVPLSNSELGFQSLKRRYYSLEGFLEHPFDGRWYGKVDYVFSRSYGNTEGQLRSDLQQTAASTSEDWDNSYIMENTNGPTNNDHTHQLKLFGYYQLTPEWLVSANLSLTSGSPKICLGYYGPDFSDPGKYGGSYHYCDGVASPPGKQGRLPWIRQLDLGTTYRPAFADGKLSFTASVFNVFNEQRPLNRYPYSQTDPGVPDPQYGQAVVRQVPRYVRLGVSYDY